MGYRWHNGRLVSDAEYEEEKKNQFILAFLLTPSLLIGWLVGTFFGATAGIWTGVAVAIISWFILPIVILISGVIWALGAIWIVLWATDLDRNVYYFFGKKTESVIGTVELYKTSPYSPAIEEDFDKILHHKAFDYKYETDTEIAKVKFRSTYSACMKAMWPEAVKFGKMNGFNVISGSPREKSNLSIAVSRKSYESIGNYTTPPLPQNTKIIVSCSHESKTPHYIKKALVES